MKKTMSSKGRITLPAAVRRRLGLRKVTFVGGAYWKYPNLIGMGGLDSNCFRIAPALTVTKPDIRENLEILLDAFAAPELRRGATLLTPDRRRFDDDARARAGPVDVPVFRHSPRYR